MDGVVPMNMITRCDSSRCSRIIYKGDSYYKVHMGDFEFDLCRNCVELIVGDDDIKESEKMLVQNGIEKDEASTVLQALGYVLLDTELYNER